MHPLHAHLKSWFTWSDNTIKLFQESCYTSIHRLKISGAVIVFRMFCGTCAPGVRQLSSRAQRHHHPSHTVVRATLASPAQQSANACQTPAELADAPCSRRTCLLAAFSAVAFSPAYDSNAAIIDEDASTRVFDTATPSVVSIADFLVQGGQEVAEGTGSGFVWDSYGHIVTNYHCIAKLARDTTGNQVTRVGFLDAQGNTVLLPARLAAGDASHDLAVLRVDPAGIPAGVRPVQIGTSRDLKVGQSVYAIGNPFGLSRTLTVGVVSGINRTIPTPAGTKTPAIQTDAAISAGNSGGPLLDSSGRLVGVNTATFTRSGSGRSSGVNFALPVDMVLRIVPNLIVYGNAFGKGV